jgi:hypothetical protein
MSIFAFGTSKTKKKKLGVVVAVGVEILDFNYWISIGLDEIFTTIYWKATFEKCHHS